MIEFKKKVNGKNNFEFIRKSYLTVECRDMVNFWRYRVIQVIKKLRNILPRLLLKSNMSYFERVPEI